MTDNGSNNRFILEGFNHCVRLPFVDFNVSYEIQSWCEEKFGLAESGSWAEGYAGNSEYQDWFFKDGKDALLFKLRWA